MASISNVRIGACSVKFNGVSLGHTKEGVNFKFDRKFEDLSVDQYGETPIDMALVGQDLTIEVMLAEPQLGNLNIAIPEADNATGASGTRLGLGTDAGYLLRSDSAQLILHPLNNATADLSDDVTIYKAVSYETVEMAYKIDEQRIVKVTFRALVDETNANGRRLGHIGYTNIS